MLSQSVCGAAIGIGCAVGELAIARGIRRGLLSTRRTCRGAVSVSAGLARVALAYRHRVAAGDTRGAAGHTGAARRISSFGHGDRNPHRRSDYRIRRRGSRRLTSRGVDRCRGGGHRGTAADRGRVGRARRRIARDRFARRDRRHGGGRCRDPARHPGAGRPLAARSYCPGDRRLHQWLVGRRSSAHRAVPGFVSCARRKLARDFCSLGGADRRHSRAGATRGAATATGAHRPVVALVARLACARYLAPWSDLRRRRPALFRQQRFSARLSQRGRAGPISSLRR